jgi:hypothetical protein
MNEEWPYHISASVLLDFGKCLPGIWERRRFIPGAVFLSQSK